MAFGSFQKALTLILSDDHLSHELVDPRRFADWVAQQGFDLDPAEWQQLRQTIERSALDSL